MKLDRTEFDRLMRDMADIPDAMVGSGLQVFRQNTPVLRGNAKRRTRRSGSDTILADYDYASVLDAGASRKAPDGMSGPTIAHWEKQIQTRLRGL